jgi:hypothetical protein
MHAVACAGISAAIRQKAAAAAHFANIAKAPRGPLSLVRGGSASRHAPEIMLADHPSLAPNYTL